MCLCVGWLQVDNYLHVTGAFWGSEEIAAQAGAEQQEAHKQLLEDMTTERRQTVSMGYVCSACSMLQGRGEDQLIECVMV